MRLIHRLKEKQVIHAQPDDRDYKLTDGGGLYLLVTSAGGRHWKLKYHFNGKEKKMPLGAYPTVGLAEARDRHRDASKLLDEGIDPMVDRKAGKAETQRKLANSFEAVYDNWFTFWQEGKKPRHVVTMKSRCLSDLLPAVGTMPVAEIKASHIREIALRIESRGAKELARRAVSTMKGILAYAHEHDLIEHNPAAGMNPTRFLKPQNVRNNPRVDKDELPALLRKMDGYTGADITRLGLMLMAHTFVRTSELIKAEWSEINWETRQWRIPPHRMKQVKRGGKMGAQPHIVPLAKQTIVILRSLHECSGGGRLMFPGERDAETPMSNNTILFALKRMGYKGEMTGHGFRGLASTILHEHRADHGCISEHIELQMAHIEGGTRRDYDYSESLPERTKMMQWWADYLEKARRKPSRRIQGAA